MRLTSRSRDVFESGLVVIIAVTCVALTTTTPPTAANPTSFQGVDFDDDATVTTTTFGCPRDNAIKRFCFDYASVYRHRTRAFWSLSFETLELR